DPQGSAGDWADTAGENLPFDVAQDTNPELLAQLRKLDYDIVLVDAPGSLQDDSVLRTVVAEADFVILPTEPAALSIRPLLRTVNDLVKPTGTPYRVLLNKCDGRTPGRTIDAAGLLDSLGLARLRAYVRLYAIHQDGPITGQVVTQYQPAGSGQLAIDDFTKVTDELHKIWESKEEEAAAELKVAH
ncbi:ParA family protein, partial [Nocardioides sp. Root140]|uniref:ParA family protein n=1 Tax=Nocardioides sp. Root140 TaxID=1736460 RepID=UPI0006F23808